MKLIKHFKNGQVLHQIHQINFRSKHNMEDFAHQSSIQVNQNLQTRYTTIQKDNENICQNVTHRRLTTSIEIKSRMELELTKKYMKVTTGSAAVTWDKANINYCNSKPITKDSALNRYHCHQSFIFRVSRL